MTLVLFDLMLRCMIGQTDDIKVPRERLTFNNISIRSRATLMSFARRSLRRLTMRLESALF